MLEKLYQNFSEQLFVIKLSVTLKTAGVVLQKNCFDKFNKTQRKTPAPKLFKKLLQNSSN